MTCDPEHFCLKVAVSEGCFAYHSSSLIGSQLQDALTRTRTRTLFVIWLLSLQMEDAKCTQWAWIPMITHTHSVFHISKLRHINTICCPLLPPETLSKAHTPPMRLFCTYMLYPGHMFRWVHICVCVYIYITLSGVMALPEHFQQFLQAHVFRKVDHSHHLCLTSQTCRPGHMWLSHIFYIHRKHFSA